jgi:GntR family transcriptional regulator
MDLTITDLAGRSALPLYGQIASLMRTRIEQREWGVGNRIPTVDALAREYGVAKITIRQALDELAEQGLISRGRGRGTFVEKNPGLERWVRLPVTWSELLRSGNGLLRKLLESDVVAGDGLLDPGEGEPAASYRRIRRVHMREDLPYCLIDIYLALDIYDMAPVEFENELVLPLLSQRLGKTLGNASQRLVIAAADVRAAVHLRIPVGSPVAKVRRIVRDVHGRVIHLSHIEYPSRFVSLEMDLRVGEDA